MELFYNNNKKNSIPCLHMHIACIISMARIHARAGAPGLRSESSSKFSDSQTGSPEREQSWVVSSQASMWSVACCTWQQKKFVSLLYLLHRTYTTITTTTQIFYHQQNTNPHGSHYKEILNNSGSSRDLVLSHLGGIIGVISSKPHGAWCKVQCLISGVAQRCAHTNTMSHRMKIRYLH